jgi:hypothetical protein
MDVLPVDRKEKVEVREGGGRAYREKIVVDKGAERRLFTDRLARLVYLVTGVIDSLIGVRVLLKLIAANPDNLFASLIYRLTDWLLRPFASLVANPIIGGSVIEITSIIAMVVYTLIGWVLVQFIWILLFRSNTRSVSIYHQERDKYK